MMSHCLLKLFDLDSPKWYNSHLENKKCCGNINFKMRHLCPFTKVAETGVKTVRWFDVKSSFSKKFVLTILIGSKTLSCLRPNALVINQQPGVKYDPCSMFHSLSELLGLYFAVIIALQRRRRLSTDFGC